jgi:hypothetical protein
MHYLLSLKVKIWIIVLLAAVIAGAANWFGFDRVGLSAVVGMVEFFVIYILFRSWTILTRVSLMPRPAWMRTDLSGEWVGEIHSQWKTMPDAAPSDPIPTSLDLRQEWGEVVFSFRTDKMRSRSAGAVPSYDPITRELRFRYFYETEPTAASNDANPPQQLGSALACVQLDKPDRMRIRYTNERSPGGDIELRRRRKKEAARVSAA